MLQFPGILQQAQIKLTLLPILSFQTQYPEVPFHLMAGFIVSKE
jgi:hypothetical protein